MKSPESFRRNFVLTCLTAIALIGLVGCTVTSETTPTQAATPDLNQQLVCVGLRAKASELWGSSLFDNQPGLHNACLTAATRYLTTDACSSLENAEAAGRQISMETFHQLPPNDRTDGKVTEVTTVVQSLVPRLCGLTR